MSSYKQLLKIAFKKLSKQLKVTEDFITDIHEDENSWSFISKLAQLVEGVFTTTLVQRLNEPEIFDTISSLPQITRIALSHDLKIISRDQRFLFLTIAEIRNDYIHDISNVGSSLNDYLSGLKSDRKKEIFKRFKPFLEDKEMAIESFIENSRNIFFVACALEIVKIHGDVEGLDAERSHKVFRANQAERLLPKKIEDTLYLNDRMAVLDWMKNAEEVLKNNGLL
jgi:hypothetical protein